MKDTLSMKERKFIDAYIDSGNLEAAVKAAGYKCSTPQSARQMGRDLLKRIQPTIDEMMEMAGLSNPIIFKKLAEGLDAVDIKFINDSKGKLKQFGITDYTARARYIEIIAKMKGLNKVEVVGKDDTPFFGPLCDSLDKMVKNIMEGK